MLLIKTMLNSLHLSFRYLERKRADGPVGKKKKEKDMDDDSDAESVDDDEFNRYLDSLGADKSNLEDDDDDEVDFMTELSTDLKDRQHAEKNKRKNMEDDDDGAINDWGSDQDSNADENDKTANSDDGDDDDEDEDARSLEDEMMNDDAESGDDDSIMSFSDEDESEDDEPKSKKSKKLLNVFDDKDFQKKLKESTGDSLFAGADEFAAMIEEAGKLRGHGTIGEIFNKDKASDKQMSWETDRNKKPFKKNKFNAKKKFGGNLKKKNLSKPKAAVGGKKNKINKKK